MTTVLSMTNGHAPTGAGVSGDLILESGAVGGGLRALVPAALPGDHPLAALPAAQLLLADCGPVLLGQVGGKEFSLARALALTAEVRAPGAGHLGGHGAAHRFLRTRRLAFRRLQSVRQTMWWSIVRPVLPRDRSHSTLNCPVDGRRSSVANESA
jgi:hypothetical protein